MIGLAFIVATTSFFSTPPALKPRNTSAPRITSARLRWGVLLGEDDLVLVHQLGATFVDDASQVGDPDVLARQPQLHQQRQASQRRSARAPRVTSLICWMSLPVTRNAFSTPAPTTMAVPCWSS